MDRPYKPKAADCRRGKCGCYYGTGPMVWNQTARYGFREPDGFITWLPNTSITTISDRRRQHLRNRYADPGYLIEQGDDFVTFTSWRVDELVDVAVTQLHWTPVVDLDENFTHTGKVSDPAIHAASFPKK